jgi:hypothetical protein
VDGLFELAARVLGPAQRRVFCRGLPHLDSVANDPTRSRSVRRSSPAREYHTALSECRP